MSKKITYQGSCHCGGVKFEVVAPKNLKASDCNCSICTKKQNYHVIVPASDFKLICGEELLTTYTFNTHIAKHTFCSKCGVQSFYTPRSDPDCFGIMPHCLDNPQPVNVIFKKFNGQNWEEERAKLRLGL